eukprot:3432153-Rhodomonas_salina.3
MRGADSIWPYRAWASTTCPTPPAGSEQPLFQLQLPHFKLRVMIDRNGTSAVLCASNGAKLHSCLTKLVGFPGVGVRVCRATRVRSVALT